MPRKTAAERRAEMFAWVPPPRIDTKAFAAALAERLDRDTDPPAARPHGETGTNTPNGEERS